MIKVKVKDTEKELFRFRIFNLFHQELMSMIIMSSILIGFGVVMFIFGDSLGLFIASLIIGIILLPATMLTTYTGTKKHFSKNPQFLEHERIFEFDEENYKIITVREGVENVFEGKYEELYRTYMTKTNFYLYINKKQAFIVPYNCFIEGSVEELLEIFKGKIPQKSLRGTKNLPYILTETTNPNTAAENLKKGQQTQNIDPFAEE